ncbi:MAG: flagellar assembly protein FliW [Ferrimicrobium sp.]|jgi:flagellar assembly factor FliW|uniref:Flagellar assembly protein FliW n=1 Tax=Ferrimicrobium acidiphilum TaxID=121039 RepID=A0ABV3Y1T6_9ACTN|nr:flagellar assembly protein FliW [Ferrimicrobium sp.]
MSQVTEDTTRTQRVLSLPLSFPIGLPGFESHHSFVLGALGPEYGPYLGLRSTLQDGPSFVIAQPSELGIEMAVDIDDFHQSLLGINDAGEVLVMLIATLDAHGGNPTVNTQAPLVINVSNWRCAQILQGNQAYNMHQEVEVPLRDEARVSLSGEVEE